MDKQIIIDGVDVSGCQFYSEKLSTMKGTGFISVAKSNGFCTHNIRGLDNSSCYDAHIEYARCKNNNCYYKQLKRKEQKCEELKKELDFQKSMYECARADEEDKFEEILELKQTLAEIKKLVEKEFYRHIACCEFCANSNDCLNQKIIEKINEVENDRT